ncbi:MAG: DUF4368 domain-containing protein, partial [Oscillospiraceae bacterium]|nr:DUF4368 domain-containing protein [Oscillospiraceae bacterium]
MWVVDEEAAEVVRQIFRWCMEGKGANEIARLLCKNQVVVPIVHAARKGIRKTERVFDPYDWGHTTVSSILSRREYLGHIINFKTYQKSFKHRKRLFNDPDKHVILENKHPAIIEEDVFNTVQQLRATKKRPSFSGRVNLFQGLCRCADCKTNMILSCGNCIPPSKDAYTCSGFARKKKLCDSSHYIRRVVLEQAILTYLQRVTAYAAEHEDELVQKLQAQNEVKVQKDLTSDKKALALAEKRIVELDDIIAELFEKNVTGILSDERFVKLSQGYEAEQKEVAAKAHALKTHLQAQQGERMKTDNFLSVVRKYTKITELSVVMLNELVERIEVHAPDRSTGKRLQRIEIYFNFVGNIGEVW